MGIPLQLMDINVPYLKTLPVVLRWIYLVIMLFYKLLVYLPKQEINVIEAGIGRPKSMDEIVYNLPVYDMSILTNIDYVHSENFTSLNEIAKEKCKLLNNTAEGGLIIYNGDIELIKNNITPRKTSSCVVAKHVQSEFFIKSVESNLEKFILNFIFDEKEYHILITNKNYLLPTFLAYNFAYAIIVGTRYNIPINTIIDRLNSFELPAGRCNIVKGINGSQIIDSSYNSSYVPLSNMIAFMDGIPGKKCLILSDMLCLGEIESEYYSKISMELNSVRIDYIILLGSLFKKYVSKYIHYEHYTELIRDPNLKIYLSDATVLIKGSHSTELHEIIKRLTLK